MTPSRPSELPHESLCMKKAILSVYNELLTLRLERIGEYVSRVERLGLGGDVAGGWRSTTEGAKA
ncbi:hypothetical protein GCM10010914_31050 [Deinococcus wulumuqiensis]|uniref:Uncharacterized protein n=1 Tax=Deinococcus wulumuqiensis TaxID=980427 RepID=A0AAV4K989_9DEIO|nr:hypothetical protein GCM10008021_30270 [Deinococcus wulumuqiensis]GGI94257.1 hypothetical protein GCM10010914_31050 [Deinococcus wulumuqiensis]